MIQVHKNVIHSCGTWIFRDGLLRVMSKPSKVFRKPLWYKFFSRILKWLSKIFRWSDCGRYSGFRTLYFEGLLIILNKLSLNVQVPHECMTFLCTCMVISNDTNHNLEFATLWRPRNWRGNFEIWTIGVILQKLLPENIRWQLECLWLWNELLRTYGSRNNEVLNVELKCSISTFQGHITK